MVAANLLLSNLLFFYVVQIFTESNRLEGSSGNYIVQPPAQPGPVQAGCSGPCPALASLGSLFQCLTIHGENFPVYIKLEFHMFLLVSMVTCPSGVHL